MKKMLCAATAVIICNIGLTGCGGSASNAHPEDYFTEIRAEMQGDFDVGRAAIQDKYRDEARGIAGDGVGGWLSVYVPKYSDRRFQNGGADRD